MVEDGKGLGDPNMMFPPYGPKYRQALDWLLKTRMKTYPAVLRAMNGIVRTLKRN